MLWGHNCISGNLDTNFTPLKFRISIMKGSGCNSLWLQPLCWVSWKSPIPLSLPFIPPFFSLMCLIMQLHADLSHGTIRLCSTVEKFRWSATHDWKLIIWNVGGELLVTSSQKCCAPRLMPRMYSASSIISIMQIHSLRGFVQIHRGWDHLPQAVLFHLRHSPFCESSPLIELRCKMCTDSW